MCELDLEDQMMDKNVAPVPHPDRWVNLPGGYVTQVTERLTATGLLLERSWMDPYDPRDATIRLLDPTAKASDGELTLVWDEVSGWRRGRFIRGEQGVRTELAGVDYVGGGVLPSGDDVVSRVLAGASEPRRVYRSVADRDGLDEALLARR
jgi:Family of unknown function (DUF6292)